MWGLWVSVRASATRCCWPPESWSARIYALSRMPTLSSDSSALSLSSLRNAPSSTRQKGISGTQAESTFLITVVRVTRLNDWNTMPMPRRNCRSALPDRVLTSVPFTVSVPEVIRCIRFTARSSVDLPAPERPMMATNSPSRMVRFTSSRPTVPLGYTLDTWSNTIIRSPLLPDMKRGEDGTAEGSCLCVSSPRLGKFWLSSRRSAPE